MKGQSNMLKKRELNLSREIFPGVFRITLPLLGEKPGPVNTYLFVGKNITLLDTGTVESADLLETALTELGLNFSDIDQVLITHGHIDHYGAANQSVRKAGGGIRVAAHEADVQRIETGVDVSRETTEDFARLMGVPKNYRQEMQSLNKFIRLLAENCRVDFTLNDGDEIQLGNYSGKVISTPGHSKGSVCLYFEKEKVLFSGDHILGHITPNALVMLDDKHDLPVRLSQKEFYRSIARIEQLFPSTIYPAHGEAISDLKKIVEGYRNNFAERENNIISILRSGEQTVYKIARKLFPEIGGSRLSLDITLAISEVYTHLQVLQQENRVKFEINKNLEVIYVGNASTERY